MKRIFTLVIPAALATPALAETKTAPPNASAAAATKEIQKAFGFVPAFVKSMPQVMLAPWWEQTRR